MFILVVYQVQIDTVDSDSSGSEGDITLFDVCIEAIPLGVDTVLQAAVVATLTVDREGKAGLSVNIQNAAVLYE